MRDHEETAGALHQMTPHEADWVLTKEVIRWVGFIIIIALIYLFG